MLRKKMNHNLSLNQMRKNNSNNNNLNSNLKKTHHRPPNLTIPAKRKEIKRIKNLKKEKFINLILNKGISVRK
jgi:hypothetical protein